MADSSRLRERAMLHVIVPQRASSPEATPRSIASVLAYACEQPVHIVLAWNGSRALTRAYPTHIERAAAERGWPFTLVRVEAPGKPGALNAADAAIDAGSGGGTGPRAYIDADVALSPSFAQRLADALVGEERPVIAVAPVVHEQFRSRVCRSFFNVWKSLPYTRQWCPGNGFYAVSEAGRRRWERFPDLHSDDTIVRLLFDPAELVVVPSCYTFLQPPSTAWSLIRARARWSRGSRLAHRMMGATARRPLESRWRGMAGMVCRRPALLIDLPFCAAVMAASWMCTKMSLRAGKTGAWQQAR